MTEIAAPRRNRLLLDQWIELMAEPSFRRFWFMRLASHGASNALTYALFVFTIRHSDSAIATGILLLTLIVPSALLGAIAGVAIDRLPRGLILFTANLLRAGLVFLLVGAKDSLPTLYAVSLGLGVVTQFAVPAESAVVPEIVRNHRLVSAHTFINLGTLASQVFGLLILAPLLLKTTDGAPLLVILACLFALSAALITVIPQFRFSFGSTNKEVSLRAVRREFAEGWFRVCRDSTAFLALVLLVATSILVLVIATLLPKFAGEVLNIDPANIVFVLAPVGLAVFVGLRSVEYLSARLNKLVTISAAYVLMAVALIALGLVQTGGAFLQSLDPLGSFSSGPLNEQVARIFVTVVLANAFGFSITVVLTMGRVLLNERIPRAMQGRVFAAQSVLSNLVAVVPVVCAGLFADAVGVEPVLIFAGVAALLAAAWTHARSTRVLPLQGEASVP